MNDTNENHNNADASELSVEQLDQVSGGITPIPIPGALILPTTLRLDLTRTLESIVHETTIRIVP